MGRGGEIEKKYSSSRGGPNEPHQTRKLPRSIPASRLDWTLIFFSILFKASSFVVDTVIALLVCMYVVASYLHPLQLVDHRQGDADTQYSLLHNCYHNNNLLHMCEPHYPKAFRVVLSILFSTFLAIGACTETVEHSTLANINIL